MNDDGYYDYISIFTLALMVDSGWYRIDNIYKWAEPFYFGYQTGCTFVYYDCIDRYYRYSNYPEFWCDSEDDIGCFYDYSRTSNKCLYYDDYDDGTIPVEYQYFGYSSIGGPVQTDYCPFLSPKDESKLCIDSTMISDEYNIFEETFGNLRSRCVQTNSGSTKLTATCFNVFCNDWNSNMNGYENVMIEIKDKEGDVQQNVTCYRMDEGATLNVDCSIEHSECLSITCPYIDIICGKSSKPFECYYGHYDDIEAKCICNPGYKGDKCLNHDLGFESLQLYSSSDPILITYYYTFCIYGLIWGKQELINNINGLYILNEISNNDTLSAQYNTVYINQNNTNYIIYYKHCDETWYIKNNITNEIIGKCLHNKFDWTDYGAVVSCNTFWYIDHEQNGAFLRDVNVKMSDGELSDSCNKLIDEVQPFANYQYICIEQDIIDENDEWITGTYRNDGNTYLGYSAWTNDFGQFGDDDDALSDYTYLTFEGASWHLHAGHIYDNPDFIMNIILFVIHLIMIQLVMNVMENGIDITIFTDKIHHQFIYHLINVKVIHLRSNHANNVCFCFFLLQMFKFCFFLKIYKDYQHRHLHYHQLYQHQLLMVEQYVYQKQVDHLMVHINQMVHLMEKKYL